MILNRPILFTTLFLSILDHLIISVPFKMEELQSLARSASRRQKKPAYPSIPPILHAYLFQYWSKGVVEWPKMTTTGWSAVPWRSHCVIRPVGYAIPCGPGAISHNKNRRRMGHFDEIGNSLGKLLLSSLHPPNLWFVGIKLKLRHSQSKLN